MGFEEKGVTAGFMVRMKKPLWGTGRVLVMDSGFYVMEGLISMVGEVFLGSELIKKRRFWPKGVPVEEIIWHMQNK